MEPDEKTASMSSDNNADSCQDDETVEEPPPPTAQSPAEVTARSQSSNRSQNSSASSPSANVKYVAKNVAGTARPGAVHMYPSGVSENNISALGAFAPAQVEDRSRTIERHRSHDAAHWSNHQGPPCPGLWVDTTAGWSVDGISVPTRPSLAHANQSFRSIDESTVRPPPTVSSLSSRSFFSRHQRFMQEEAARQRGDEIVRQYVANIRSGEQQIAVADHLQGSPYVTPVATPVPVDKEIAESTRNKKRAVCDMRVLLVTLVFAIAALVGMAVTVVLKTRERNVHNGRSTGSNIVDGRQNDRDDSSIVSISPFSMQMTTTDTSTDQDLLLSATISHLSTPMENEIVSFEELQLNITVQNDRSNILSNIYPTPRVRGKTDTVFAFFEGVIKLKPRSRTPDQREIYAIIGDAFSGSGLEQYVAALEDVGIIPVSLVVSDEFGEVIGASKVEEEGSPSPTGSVQNPTPPPTATDGTKEETETPTGSSGSFHPTLAPGQKSEPESPQMSPTERPSKIPTTAPTGLPTEEATEVYVLTEAPTSTPSFAPTLEPTEPPSKAPTYLPTKAPTSIPTIAPTTYPTFEPTPLPTFPPSQAPTSRQPISFDIEPQPGFLTTTIVNKFSRGGGMFDIRAKGSAVSITSIELHIESTATEIPVEVWTGRETYVGFEKYSRVWTQRNGGRPYVIPRGLGPGRLTAIPVDVFEPISIPARSTLAIYVTLQSGKGMWFGNGDYVSEDEYLRIESGASVGFRFDTPMNRDRAWSGAIRYAVE